MKQAMTRRGIMSNTKNRTLDKMITHKTHSTSNHKSLKMCYLCFIFIFLLDPECFKIKTKLNSSFDITAPLTQSNDSNNKTSSDVSMYINYTTAGTPSDLQHVINNGNKLGHGKDSTSVIHMVFYIRIGLALFHIMISMFF